MPAIISGLGAFDVIGGAPTMQISLNESARLYDRYAVQNTNALARQLKVYSDVTLDPNTLEMVFASFSTPRSLFRARQNGCTWNPVGGVSLGVERYPTCPIEYNGEQCPDAFWNGCWERIFGQGNEIHNLLGTAEGQDLVDRMLRQIYTGLGNSFADLSDFANHPRLTIINNNGLWQGDAGAWEAYYSQQMGVTCGGIVTQLDALHAQGLPNVSVIIPPNHVDLATKTYTGDVVDLANAVIAASTPEMNAAIISGVNGMLPVWLATAPVYRAFETYLESMSPTNEQAYRFMLNASDAPNGLSRTALRYKGMAMIQWDGFAQYDAITGDQSYRLALVAPGTFGILSDVQGIATSAFRGAGLAVQQSPLLKDKGMLWMLMNLRFGTGIADTRFVSMASGTYR